MENDNKNIPASIWDGWEKQSNFADDGESKCAFMYVRPKGVPVMLFPQALADALCRVNNYICDHYDLPETWMRYSLDRDGYGAIFYANDVLKLTPNDFRRIDIETQIEAVAKPLIDSVPVSEPISDVDRISYLPESVR